METLMMAPTPEQLAAVAVSAIIAKAALLSRDPECDKWTLYEAAKGAIEFQELPADEYQGAIKLLADALGV